MEAQLQNLLDQYPFLTYLTYGGSEYIGVIQNHDDVVTTIYDYGALHDADRRGVYLDLADQWWFESNRMTPINIFLKQDWDQFRDCVKTFVSKDVIIVHGPQISLKEIAAQRTKRKSITLVKRTY